MKNLIKNCLAVFSLIILLPGFSFADSSVSVIIKSWDFENEDIGSWQVSDPSGKSTISLTGKSLQGSSSLVLNYNDYLRDNFFKKGFKIDLEKPLGFQEFSFLSLSYRLSTLVEELRISLVSENGDWFFSSKEIKEKEGKFLVSAAELLRSNLSPLKEVKIKTVYIFAKNKRPFPRGEKLNLSFTIDNIAFGLDLCKPSTIQGEHPYFAIAARKRGSIKIDGKLTEEEWAGAVPITLTELEQITVSRRPEGIPWEGPSDLSAVITLLWDNDYLYFGAKVQDDKVICTNPDPMRSDNDSIKLFFRTAPPPDEKQDVLGEKDYAFYISPFGLGLEKPLLKFPRYGRPGEAEGVPKKFPLESVKIASSATETGYSIEMAIPWSGLGILPNEGQCLGFFTFIDDTDTGYWEQQIAWRKLHTHIDRYWDNSASWGKLFLTRGLTDKEAISVAMNTGSVKIKSNKEEYKMNEDVIGTLDLYFPLITEDEVKFQIEDDQGRIREKLISSISNTPLSTQFSASWNTKREPDGDYSLSSSLNKEISLSTPIKLVGVKEKEREANRRKSKDSLILLAEEIKERNKLYHLGPLYAYTDRVDPSKWSLAIDPVTWDDLGGEFQGHIQTADLTPRSLDTFFKYYDFGRCIKAIGIDIDHPNWKDWFKDIASRELIIIEIEAGGPGKWPIEKQEYIRRIMGRHFFGFAIGEDDIYYAIETAPGHKPSTRIEAQKLFWDYTEKNDFIPWNYYVQTLGSFTWSHQYAAMGWPRILGIQTSQTFPSDIVDWAFLRGAGKQYGILTWTNISVYNRWGWKNYMETGWHPWHGDHGPDKGPSLSLLKRLWYVSYMYGSATTGFETSYFTDEKDEQGYPKLSPIGEINVEAVKWSRKHNKDRGVQWTPVALLIDFTSGWLPPQYSLVDDTYLVWGNMDYQKGDYQIDNFFRWIYPGYEDCAYFKDERGHLTPTPFGDKFDVLTSDVQERILNQYSVVYLLGEINMTSSLITRLKEYTKKGGTLILSAEDARDFGSDFSGLSIGGRREGYGSLSLFDKKIFEEKDYIYTEVMPEKAEVLAVSEDNLPLITVNSFGKGRVVVITPDYGMTTRLKISDGGGVHPARYELLNIVKHILGEYFKDLDFTEIQGPEIQYIVNLTKDTKRILLTLVNNDKETDWEGTVSLKKGKVLSAKEWMEDKELPIRQKGIEIKVPKGDLRVIEITSNKPLFRNERE